MYTMSQKLIATMLVAVIMLAEFSLIGIYGGRVFAEDDGFETQSTKVSGADLDFDAYFVDEQNKIHQTRKQIEGENNSIFISVKAATGYLKNAQVKFEDENGQEKANFTLAKSVNNNAVQSIDTENSIVKLNQINSGNEKVIEIPISFNYSENIKVSEFARLMKAKLTGTYVNAEGKEKSVSKDIYVYLVWKTNKYVENDPDNTYLNESITKFIPYNLGNGDKGVLVQQTIEVNARDNMLPVKDTNIEINVPTINDIKPTSVRVYASTEATNGDEKGDSFTTENYTYDSQNNKLTILVKNDQDNDGKVVWKKDATDVYKVVYIYPATANESLENSSSVSISHDAKVRLNLYSAGTTYVGRTAGKEQNISTLIGRMIDYDIIGNTQSIAKGMLYANYVAENKVDKEYSETWVAEIVAPEITSSIHFETIKDSLVKDDNEIAVLSNSDVYYKEVSISKANLNKIFGENPDVKIYSNGTVVATINKELVDATTEDIVKVDLSGTKSNSIKIIANMPVNVGKLEINVTKAIAGDTFSKTKAQLEQANAIKSEVRASGFVDIKTLENKVALTETESKASLEINKETLSTVIKNEGVEFKAILHSDEETNRLFKNPTLTIKLPKYIEDVQIKSSNVLHDTKLNISNVNVVNNNDGSKSIVVTLAGEQDTYSIGSLTGGANVIVKTDLLVNKLTSNRTEQVVMTYTNQNEAGSKQVSKDIRFEAPVGVITTSSIDNYAAGKTKLTSMSGVEATAEIDIFKPAVNAKFNMSVINNYNNTISDIKILGKIPSQTFDAKLQSAITVTGVDASKVKVYYSTNKDADKDLNKTSNGWTLTVSDYTTVKAYLIVVENQNLNTAEAIDFGYTAQIPANLNYNETAVESYVAYFTNNLQTGSIQDSMASTPITITTGLGPIIKTNIVSNVEAGDVVLSGNIIKYTVNVNNEGTKQAKNVKVTFNVPENTKYIEYSADGKTYTEVSVQNDVVEKNIGNINAGKSASKDFYVIVDNALQEEFKITAKASVVSDEFTTPTETNTITNAAKKAYFDIKIYNEDEDNKNPEVGKEFKYSVHVTTKRGIAKKENSVLEIKIPEGLTYKSVETKLYDTNSDSINSTNITTNYNNSTRILTVNLGTVNSSSTHQVYVTTTVDELPANTYLKNIKLEGTVKSGEVQEKSQPLNVRVEKEGLQISQTANIPSTTKISKGEKLKFNVTLKNVGSKTMEVTIKDELPEKLRFESLKYIENNREVTDNVSNDNKVEKVFVLAEGETKVIQITANALEVSEDTEVSNVVTASTKTISNLESNRITYTIEKTQYVIDPSDPSDPTEEPQGTLVRVGGVVWKDENKNGVKEAGEEFVKDVEVVLFNTVTNKSLTKNGQIVIEKTDANGMYTFDNVPSGKYIAVFMYDTGKYSATAYHASAADEYTNSDAVDSKVKFNNEEIVAAVTDIMTLSEANQYNVDLGLVDNPKFDLKLDMQISKVTVQNQEGTKTYEYDNASLAKVEFVEKNLNNSTMVVEYTIKVTNQGGVEGIVKKIADYLPKELSFSSELNRDWYENENGIVYNASLANTKILPGETKEVKLLLTKVMNESSLGTVNNRAEIYEAYNDEGIKDVDSTPGNQNSSEDDYATADLVLSIKTGKVVMFVGLTLTIITIIGTSAYFIKKKVLR